LFSTIILPVATGPARGRHLGGACFFQQPYVAPATTSEHDGKRRTHSPKKKKGTEDNEEKNEAHKKEIHRQGCRNYSNVRQPGNDRYARATWDGEQQDLQVPIYNSSTSGDPEYSRPTHTDQYSTPYICTQVVLHQQMISETQEKPQVQKNRKKQNQTTTRTDSNKKETETQKQRNSEGPEKQKDKKERGV
jgi:hypothetical protein